jgi:hypothetical protein
VALMCPEESGLTQGVLGWIRMSSERMAGHTEGIETRVHELVMRVGW